MHVCIQVAYRFAYRLHIGEVTCTYTHGCVCARGYIHVHANREESGRRRPGERRVGGEDPDVIMMARMVGVDPGMGGVDPGRDGVSRPIRRMWGDADGRGRPSRWEGYRPVDR